MKKTVSLLLAFALLFSLAACGGKTPAEPTSEYEDETEEVSTHPGALDIDTALSDYYLDYSRAEEEDAALPVLEGYGMDTADENANVANLKVDIQGTSGAKSAQFVLRSVVDETYADGGRLTPDVWLYGCLDGVLVLSVAGYEGGLEAYYLLDVAAMELKSLGLMYMFRFTGNFLLFGSSPDPQSGLYAVSVFDWAGNQLTAYENVLDVNRRRSTEDIFFITGASEALWRVAGDEFYAAEPDLTAEKLCDFGDYTALFGVYDTGVICLTRSDGGDYRVVDLADVAAELQALAAEPAETLPEKQEACDSFAVTLPGFWQENYICKNEGDVLSFYYPVTEETEEPSFIFSFTLVTPENAANFMTGSIFVKEYDRAGERCFIAVRASDPTTTELEGFDVDRFSAMLTSLDGIAETLSPVPADAEIKEIDYTPWIGEYAGKTEAGEARYLTVEFASGNVLTGKLSRPAGGETESADVSIIMLGDVGYLAVTAADGSNDGGYVSIAGKSLVVSVNGAETGWTGGDRSEVVFSPTA